MPRFLVELWLDGYEDDSTMTAACLEFIQEQLDFSGSSVTVEPLTTTDEVTRVTD